jgi:phosphoribosyl 1,2-cyclic phosphodiesterase
VIAGGKGDASLRYSVLGSGSAANAYLFEDESSAVLVDNGFSVRELLDRAAAAGHDWRKIRMILLTHTHSDHIRGVGSAARRLHVPVALHRDIPPERIISSRGPQILSIEPGAAYRIGPFSFTPFETSHDAPCSLSFALSHTGFRFLIITDTGIVTEQMRLLAETADVLFLEANYEEQLLESGPYPGYLKRRIASPLGHLSNRSAVEFLQAVYRGSLHIPQSIYLCHLSAVNNTPDHVHRACRILDDLDLPITICEKNGLYTAETGEPASRQLRTETLGGPPAFTRDALIR